MLDALAGQASPVYINGRFLAQTLSGVQRFASEITMAFGRLAERLGEPSPIILVPAGRRQGLDRVGPAEQAATAGLTIRPIGRRGGQLWEQFELPGGKRDGVLINLGNTAPLLAGRQIVVVHDAGVFRSPETYSWRFRAWYRLMQGWHVRGPATIVTVSEFSRREIIRFLGAQPADVRVITEGADHMHRLVPDLSVLRRHGLQAGKFVLAVGNLARHKNLVALGETAKALAARGIDLAIAGGIDQSVFNSRQAAMPSPACYLGRVSDEELCALYGAARCFVFPSLYEGFGLPAIEAMACGCPVVASDITSLREVCADAALYCDPTDPRDIAEKVCRLVDHDEDRERLRISMADRVKLYTWEIAAQRLHEVVASLRHAEGTPSS